MTGRHAGPMRWTGSGRWVVDMERVRTDVPGARRAHGQWVISLLAILSVAAAGGDHRVADAVESRDAAALNALLKQTVDVNTPQADGTTALHWAAHWDDLPTVERLLRAGAKIEAPNRYGVTPLFVASTNGNATIIERLLKAGANANTVSGVDAAAGEGQPALLAAARTGNVAAVKALLAYGADASATEHWHQQTALMWAAVADSPAAVQALIDAGADVAATAEGGFTALHYAARAGSLDASRVLVAAGADVTALLGDRSSPLMLAIINARYQPPPTCWIMGRARMTTRWDSRPCINWSGRIIPTSSSCRRGRGRPAISARWTSRGCCWRGARTRTRE